MSRRKIAGRLSPIFARCNGVVSPRSTMFRRKCNQRLRNSMASHSHNSDTATWPAWLRNLPIILIVVGGLGALVGFFTGKDHGIQLGYSYLLAYMFFLSICLGGLFLVIL